MSETRSDDPVSRAEVYFVVVGAALLIACLHLTAAELRVGSETKSISISDLSAIGVGMHIALVALATASTVEILIGHRRSSIAKWGFGAMAFLSLATIVWAEGVEALIPRDLLPTTLRRFTLAGGTGVAPWVTAVVCVVVVLAANGRVVPLFRRLRVLVGESTTGHWVRIAAGGLSAAGLLLVAVGRNQPLLRADASGTSVEVSAWAVPVIGPVSLALLIVLTIAATMVLFDLRTVPFSLVGSAAAWVIAVSSALVLATSGLVVKGPVTDWVADFIVKSGVELANVEAGPGGAMAVWGSLLVASSLSASLAMAGSSE